MRPQQQCALEGCTISFVPHCSQKYCWRHTGLNGQQLRKESDRLLKAKYKCATCGQPIDSDTDLCPHCTADKE